MRLKRWWVAAGVAGAALLSVQQVAQATLIRVNWSANTASEQTGLNGEDVRTAGVPISLSRDFVTRGGTAGITAEVDYGLVRFTAAAEGQASPSVSTFAGFLDELTIDVPGRTGQSGFARVRADYSWLFSQSGNEFSRRADVNVSLGGAAGCARDSLTVSERAQVVSSQQYALECATSPVDSELGSFMVFDAPIRFGTALLVAMSLSGAASASDGSRVFVNAGNSLYWGGMSVFDALGNPVSFSVTSASGTDYARSFAPVVVPPPTGAVPEPGAAALLALSLCILGAVARRRGRLR